jgi:DNA (cytosine-5)-methyltransferase 1
MRHLDLFSGIGGFALAASWVWGEEHEIAGFCEIDPYCRKVLKKHWPDAPVYPDIKELKGEIFNAIELITGGFPCQPFSCAGKQRGAEDDRYLWPEMFRIIREIQPRWIIIENNPPIINMELDNILSDLEVEGYAWEPFIIPACAVDAPHKRMRVWILANNHKIDGNISGFHKGEISQQPETGIQINTIANGQSEGLQNGRQTGIEKSQGKKNGEMAQPGSERCNCARWPIEPGVGRVANGIPSRVDRIKGLGNAIVPQVAAVLMRAIKQIDG